MDEEKVRKVMIEYFKSKGMKPNPQRGAGPDILIDGMAVETKGSRYEFQRMLKQLVSYAYKYSEVSLALPVDGLTFERASQLEILCFYLMTAGRKGFDLYIVFVLDQNRRTYGVFKCIRKTLFGRLPFVISGNLFQPAIFPVLSNEDTLEIAIKKLEPLILWNPVETAEKKLLDCIRDGTGILKASLGGEISIIQI